MTINLTELTKAVSAVAGIAAERDRAIADIKAAQVDVDALTAALLSAAKSPAEAVGLAAVAEALAPVPTAPQTIDDLNKTIAAQNAGSAV